MIHSKSFDELSAAQWQQILTLRSNAFVVEQQCVYPDPDETDLQATHVFMEEESKITGYARFYRSNAWHIGRVVTHSDHRGQGIATQILQYILNTLNSDGSTPDIELSAQVYLTPYYRGLGFHIQGTMYLEDGIPHVRMVYQRS